jgi:membrane associated rhomboid family serine protease/Zn finger protein HypA/HybF involved in hydrogenase expression
MASFICPHCHDHHLEPVHHENVELDACVHCGGLWFDRNELDKVVRTHDPDYPHEGPIVEKLGQKLGKTENQCPRCQEALTTYQIKSGNELKIDVCQSCHGVWLEKEELDYAKLFYDISEAQKRIQQETTWKDWLFQFFLTLPIEFNIKARKFPIITVILIALNVLFMLLFFMLLIIDDFDFSPEKVFLFFALFPRHIHSLLSLDSSLINTFHAVMTLFSYQFLHSGWVHLIGNMYFLYILGDNLEEAMGRILFPIFYLLCGVVAGLTHALVSGGHAAYIPLVGASGAVFGLMGAYMYIFRKAKLTFMFIIFQYKLSVGWYFILFNIVLLFVPGASVASHIGGFITGLVFSYFLYEWILRKNPLISYLNQGLTKKTEKI